MILTAKIKGAQELRQVLRQLPDRVQKRVLAAAVRKGANVVRDAVIARAPVGTELDRHRKHLYQQINVRAIRGNNPQRVALAVSTGAAYWGNFAEFGTRHQPARPFMRPAFEASAGQALAAIGVAIGKGVEREAAILAGPYARARKSLGVK